MGRIITGLLTVIVAVYLISSMPGFFTFNVSLYSVLLVLEGLWVIFGPIRYPLLGEETMRETNAFIPSADSVQVKCRYCGASYHYGPDKVGPDRTVACQNCGRTISLLGEPDQI